MMTDGFTLLIPGIGSIAVFSWLAVAAWSDARRREREAYYKSEMVKKIAETQGAGAASALEVLREQEKIHDRHRREGLKLGGLITGVVGIGLMILLRALTRDSSLDIPPATFLAGLIPLLIGIALLVYVQFMVPKV